ncbi:hypothetical protein SAMN05428970_3313 [Agromyces sp. CF514]|nr:hypothetical protein [Agromyces sp. CF514]SFR86510.1 hypothetical protein SAMN05428970_3313 [Agromyces sp. CF514]
MTILLILTIAALAVWAVAGAALSASRDGYHRLDARDASRRTPVSID